MLSFRVWDQWTFQLGGWLFIVLSKYVVVETALETWTRVEELAKDLTCELVNEHRWAFDGPPVLIRDGTAAGRPIGDVIAVFRVCREGEGVPLW